MRIIERTGRHSYRVVRDDERAALVETLRVARDRFLAIYHANGEHPMAVAGEAERGYVDPEEIERARERVVQEDRDHGRGSLQDRRQAVNQGRLRLRQDAEALAAEYAALLADARHEPTVDPEEIERARERVVQEDRDHGQLQLGLA